MVRPYDRKLNTMILTTLALVLSVQDPVADGKIAAKMMSADDPVVSVGVVDAPVRQVWTLFSTAEGAKKWMANAVKVDFRIGGSYRTSYKEDSKLDGPDTIVNDILAIDPYRMVTIRNTKAPDGFPWKAAMERCWTVIYLHDLAGKQTKVEVRMNGYDGSKESMDLKEHFAKWNQQSLDTMVKAFAKKN